MAYHKYEIKGIILNIYNFRENDILIKFFSIDFGYINILSVGARKSLSKHRPNIKEYSLSNITVIRGKEFYRLTDIKLIFDLSISKIIVTFLKESNLILSKDFEHDYIENSVEIYDLYCIIIKELSINKKNLQIMIDFFEYYIESINGYLPRINLANIKNENFEFSKFAIDTIQLYNNKYASKYVK